MSKPIDLVAIISPAAGKEEAVSVLPHPMNPPTFNRLTSANTTTTDSQDPPKHDQGSAQERARLPTLRAD